MLYIFLNMCNAPIIVRYELQLELLHKEQIVEDLQKTVNTLQTEVHKAMKTNMELQQQALLSLQSQQPPVCRKQLCEKFAVKPNQTGSGGETDEVRERVCYCKKRNNL